MKKESWRLILPYLLNVFNVWLIYLSRKNHDEYLVLPVFGGLILSLYSFWPIHKSSKSKFLLIFLTPISVLFTLYYLLWTTYILNPTGEPYIHLTRQEKDEIANLSRQCGCEVKFYYESVTSKNGEALPAIGSNGRNDSKCTIYFSWKEEQQEKSLCTQDTSYLRQFALNLLPELLQKMRYVKDYPVILFIFYTDDDTHPVNGWICQKSISIKR
jgi:hypothetical protein